MVEVKTTQECETQITVENVVLKIMSSVMEFDDGHKEVVFSMWTQAERNVRKGYDHLLTMPFVVK